MNRQSKLSRRLVLAAVILLLAGQACTLSLFESPFAPAPPPPVEEPPTPTPLPGATITFIAVIPESLQANETLVLAVLDEVTGLPFNVREYAMTPRDTQTYTATVTLPQNSIVKYKYIRRGDAQIGETNGANARIRYRMYYALGAGEAQDIIAGWEDRSPARPSGSMVGQVFNADTGSPLPNILVTAGGAQSLTDSLGRFEIANLPVGTHNLVAYSLDGMYQTFQQGALIAEGKVTIVDLRLKPAPLVNVTFIASVPKDTVPGVPLRIAGNLLQFGNTFADLTGGVSLAANRMPVMQLQPDGRYAISIGLPAGTYLQYKYTLGDGFWNAERGGNGEARLREMIVPAQDTVIEDAVASWSAGGSAPILFEATVPSVTPPNDIIYIQFNRTGWMEPIPMWSIGNNRWVYKLYGPLDFLGALAYRYCRNGQCGSADDGQTSGASPSGRQAQTSFLAQDLKDTVGVWKWFENPEPVTLVGANIAPRSSNFAAGVEYQAAYRPNFSYFAPQAFANTKALGANLAVITPTWTYVSVSPLQFHAVPGQDPLWIDSAIMISQARTTGLNVALFPTPQFPPAPDPSTPAFAAFWQAAPRDAQWWQTWYTRYRAFAVHYADLAAQTGAQFLILGGEWTVPALPNGRLPDGSPANTPADAEAQWRAMITDVRSRFRGQVLWALPYAEAGLEPPVNFLQDVDGIYLLWSVPLSVGQSGNKTEYINTAGQLLDNEIAPLVSLLKKPLILAISYPSAAGVASGCIPNGAGGCLDPSALNRPNPDIPAASLSLQTQADIYEAMLNALNARPWISGFVSRGYYLPVALQDKSASVHSKPAADILWYWYPRLLGIVP